jgi:aminoglycoside/choline kinase family phosphotransferase
VLGIFSRLHLRDSKHSYLKDLPLVIRYIIEELTPYPKLSNFLAWFECKILPKVFSQSWYEPWEEAGDSELKSNEGFKS